MLVYGDRVQACAPERLLARVRALLVEAQRAPAGVQRHDALVAALIEAGMLAQGLADAEMQATGLDAESALQTAAMALVLALARRVSASWSSGFAGDGSPVGNEVDGLASRLLPALIEVRQPEGYAFYALYPEAYDEAASRLPAGTQVIGLRSIGTSLAAMVAARAGCSEPPISLRPVGHPFDRRYAIEPRRLERLAARNAPVVAIVDEGPGLSGSSFGAMADRLEGAGVAADRIVFFPGHAGDLGPQAVSRHRIRWTTADRRLATFEDTVGPRLVAAVEELTGPAVAPLEDISGGRWRLHGSGAETAWPPVNAGQERRKFLLRSARGMFLLKFAGLGSFGRMVLSDAQQLHRAGFGPEPLGHRLGFLVMRWEQARPVPFQEASDRRRLLARVADYLVFRAGLPADEMSRAGVPELAEMAAHNIAEALGHAAADAWRATYGAGADLPALRPVRTDNRLHAWEWFVADNGTILKADGTDHCRAHDLVGCQDIGWDLAGARIEFDLTDAEYATMVREVESRGRRPIDPALLRWLVPAYLAFQIGSWSMAAATQGGAEAARTGGLLSRYRGRLQALLA